MSSQIPPSGEPEILDSSGGAQAPAPTRPSSRGSGRRTALIVGGILGGVAVIGGVAWTASWYLSSGAEAAEILPASTLGYAQVNLDPSGDQKIEALRTLNKFPGFKDNLGLDTTDDLRKELFERIQDDGGCPGLDYDDDIAPWLGDRMAIAAVDAGEKELSPVFVVQVTDQGKAEDGLDKLLACDSGDSGDTADSQDSGDSGDSEDSEEGDGGYVVDGDWAVVAETTAIAEKVVSEGHDGSLADDADFQRWTDAAGGDGIVTMYAAPAAGEKLAGLIEDEAGMFAMPETYTSEAEPAVFSGSISGSGSSSSTSTHTEASTSLGAAADCSSDPTGASLDQLRDFKGAAAKIRFADGSVEVELAGGLSETSLGNLTGSAGGDLVASLPDNTALALGGSLQSGWFESLIKQATGNLCDGPSADDLISEAESETGLSLPEDAETLTGDAFAVALSSDFDIDAMQESGDFSSLAVGVKVQGDPAAVEDVLDKIRPQLGDEDLLSSSTDGDTISFGPDQDWVEEMSGQGKLGDSDAYDAVLPDSDKASGVFYLNVDAGNDWLVKVLQDAGAGDDVIDNVRPFTALGVATWTDGDVSHAKFKLTTD